MQEIPGAQEKRWTRGGLRGKEGTKEETKEEA